MEIIGILQSIPKGRDMEIYKHQPEKGKYYCYDKNGKLFRYEDELPLIAWQLGEETKIRKYTDEKNCYCYQSDLLDMQHVGTKHFKVCLPGDVCE